MVTSIVDILVKLRRLLQRPRIRSTQILEEAACPGSAKCSRSPTGLPPAFGTPEENRRAAANSALREAGTAYSRPASARVPRSVAAAPSLISHRGRRMGPTSMPIMFMAALTGMGLTSRNRWFMTCRYRR